MADLYDHPLEFYVYACGGEFDAEMLAGLGYSDVQLAAIEKALADNPDQVKAAQAKIEEHKAAMTKAAGAPAAEAAPTEEEG